MSEVLFNLVEHDDITKFVKGKLIFEFPLPKRGDYSQFCKRVRTAFKGSYLSMFSRYEENDKRLYVMSSFPPEEGLLDGLSCTNVRASALRPYILYNLLIREAYGFSDIYGDGETDGKPYIIVEMSKKTRKDKSPLSQIHAWSPMFCETPNGDVFLRIESRTFTERAEDEKKGEKPEYWRKGSIVSFRKSPGSPVYRMGNVGNDRHTINAFSMKDNDVYSFKSSKSGLFTEVISVFKNHFGEAFRLVSHDVDITSFNNDKMKKFFMERLAHIDSDERSISIHDAVEDDESAEVMNDFFLFKNRYLPRTDFLFTDDIKEADIVLLREKKLYEESREQDPYELKSPWSQAIVVTGRAIIENKNGDRTLKRRGDDGFLSQPTTLNIANELFIKRELRAGKLSFPDGVPDFTAYARTSFFGKELDDNKLISMTNSSGDISFKATGFGEPHDDLPYPRSGRSFYLRLEEDTVEVTKEVSVHALPNIGLIMRMFDGHFDNGDPGKICIPKDIYYEAVDKAFSGKIIQEDSFEAWFANLLGDDTSRKDLGEKVKEMKKSANSKEERGEITKLFDLIKKQLELLGYPMSIKGLRNAPAIGGLAGMIVDSERRFYLTGENSGINDSVARFPTMVRCETISGEPVPEAFFQMISEQQIRYMRLSNMPFMVKHLREYQTLRIKELTES